MSEGREPTKEEAEGIPNWPRRTSPHRVDREHEGTYIGPGFFQGEEERAVAIDLVFHCPCCDKDVRMQVDLKRQFNGAKELAGMIAFRAYPEEYRCHKCDARFLADSTVDHCFCPKHREAKDKEE